MKRIILILALAFSAIAVPVIQTGCANKITLEPGGAYTDPYLAKTDQAILDSSRTLQAFVAWHAANSTFLAKYPAVGALAIEVAGKEKGWIRDAYAARDAYALAAKAYREAAGTPGADASEVELRRAKLNGALALINNITQQIVAYRAAHPHAS